MTEARIRDLIRREWDLDAIEVRPTEGGMNSTVWRVSSAIGVLYLKGVAETGADALLAGAETAALLSRAGMRAGAPRPCNDGELLAIADSRAWVLLEAVEGRPLTISAADQLLWGAALGRAHRLMPEVADDDPRGWVPIVLDPSGQPPWLRDAIVRTAHDLADVEPLTWVRLHTDPEPEAFRVDERDDVGMIDWTGSRAGPALYDLASAVMYAGGASRAESLIGSYRRSGPVPESEIDAHLRTFGRLRAVVQGVYFSSRLARNDLTGIDGPDENVKGLEDARGMVAELSGPS